VVGLEVVSARDGSCDDRESLPAMAATNQTLRSNMVCISLFFAFFHLFSINQRGRRKKKF
jgi:hypothetical protein